MDLNKANRMAHEIRKDLNLEGWAIRWGTAKKRAGVCNFTGKYVMFSKYLFTKFDEAECKDTILHEFAHAIAGHAAGHGPEWKRVARSIGCNAQRTYDGTGLDLSDAYKWVGVCPNGHMTGKRMKRMKLSCAKCDNTKFNPAYMIQWLPLVNGQVAANARPVAIPAAKPKPVVRKTVRTPVRRVANPVAEAYDKGTAFINWD